MTGGDWHFFLMPITASRFEEAESKKHGLP